MPLYTIEPTSQKGQCLLVSTDKRGIRPIVSLQIPEVRATQLVEALNFIQEISKNNSLGIKHFSDYIHATAKAIIDLPIEKS